jgi:hypothetical protein
MGGGHFFPHQQLETFFNNVMLNIITIASAITIKLTSEITWFGMRKLVPFSTVTCSWDMVMVQ